MSALLERLTYQIFENGSKSYEESRKIANAVLKKRGHLNEDGTETFDGAVRGMMTAEERAIDRRIKKSGGAYNDYKYDSVKNYAYKIRKDK